MWVGFLEGTWTDTSSWDIELVVVLRARDTSESRAGKEYGREREERGLGVGRTTFVQTLNRFLLCCYRTLVQDTRHPSRSPLGPPDSLFRLCLLSARLAPPFSMAVTLPPASDAPSLLPPPVPSPWQPSKVFAPAKPPPQDDRAQLAYQAELAYRQSHQNEHNNRDYSNSSKKLRARRTIDYFGEMGKWELVRPRPLFWLPVRAPGALENGQV